jgi:beta-propeller repeat-containing protein
MPGVRKLAFVLAAYGGALAISGILPALFVENAQGRLAAHGAGLTMLYSPGAVTLEHRGARVKLEFVGARRGAIPQGFDAQPARVNLIRGGAPPMHLNTWSGVIYRDLYPGVTLRFIARNGRIESEYLLAPGAGARRIRLRYRGAKPHLDGTALALDGFDPSFRETIPAIYEFSSSGARTPIAGGFAIARSGIVSFRISGRHATAPLVIDPAFSFASSIGGSGTEKATGVALDGAGAIYVAGYTDSPDFPGGGASRGGVDAFIVKFDPTGANVVYATYFGGSGDDRAFGIGRRARPRAHRGLDHITRSARGRGPANASRGRQRRVRRQARSHRRNPSVQYLSGRIGRR